MSKLGLDYGISAVRSIQDFDNIRGEKTVTAGWFSVQVNPGLKSACTKLGFSLMPWIFSEASIMNRYIRKLKIIDKCS
jgi:hypothetical protein